MKRFVVLSGVLLMTLAFMLVVSHPAAADSTAGNTAVGSNKYPPNVGELRRIGRLTLAVGDYGVNCAVIDPSAWICLFRPV